MATVWNFREGFLEKQNFTCRKYNCKLIEAQASGKPSSVPSSQLKLDEGDNHLSSRRADRRLCRLIPNAKSRLAAERVYHASRSLGSEERSSIPEFEHRSTFHLLPRESGTSIVSVALSLSSRTVAVSYSRWHVLLGLSSL